MEVSRFIMRYGARKHDLGSVIDVELFAKNFKEAREIAKKRIKELNNQDPNPQYQLHAVMWD